MLKDNCLTGKNFIITGGGSGLGKSMSSYLLELGANVIIASRNEDKLSKTVNELTILCKNNEISYSVCDVKKSEDINVVIEDAFKKYKKIDGLVNNAAGNFISPTERLSPNAFAAIIDLRLQAGFLGSQPSHGFGTALPLATVVRRVSEGFHRLDPRIEKVLEHVEWIPPRYHCDDENDAA